MKKLSRERVTAEKCLWPAPELPKADWEHYVKKIARALKAERRRALREVFHTEEGVILRNLKMMLRRKPMDAFGFKWKVGDVVSPKFSTQEKEDEATGWLRNRNSIKLHIVERLYQECPGGVQRHYICRPIDYTGGTPHVKCIQFNEIELTDLLAPETGTKKEKTA